MSESESNGTASAEHGLDRRAWGKVALVAGVVGVGAGLAWRTRQRLAQGGASSVGEPVDPAFWQQSLNRPDGVALLLSAFQGRPLVLNFWATWCPPCVEEMPLLNSFYQQNKDKGWQVLGLAVDQAAPVQRFIAQNDIAFPVAMAGFAGIELSKRLGNTQGALPFTVVFSAAARVVHRKMGRVNASDVLAWVASQA
ncbi:MAG: hypothetical protein Fur007_00190 [Rhodoferax sp.]